MLSLCYHLVIMTTWVGEREMWSRCINVEIPSLLLWPIDPLLSDALLYFYDNKHILIFWFWYSVHFHRCCATRKINTKVNLSWSHTFRHSITYIISICNLCLEDGQAKLFFHYLLFRHFRSKPNGCYFVKHSQLHLLIKLINCDTHSTEFYH